MKVFESEVLLLRYLNDGKKKSITVIPVMRPFMEDH